MYIEDIKVKLAIRFDASAAIDEVLKEGIQALPFHQVFNGRLSLIGSLSFISEFHRPTVLHFMKDSDFSLFFFALPLATLQRHS